MPYISQNGVPRGPKGRDGAGIDISKAELEAIRTASEAARDDTVRISGIDTADQALVVLDADPTSEFRQQADARQAAAVAAQVDAAAIGSAPIAYDTDGTPYITDNGSGIAYDTDGTPYVTIGA